MSDISGILIIAGLTLAQIVACVAAVWWFKTRRTAARLLAASQAEQSTEAPPPEPSAVTVPAAEETATSPLSEDLPSSHREAALAAGVSEEAADLMDHIISTNHVDPDRTPAKPAPSPAEQLEPAEAGVGTCVVDEETPEAPDAATRLPGRRSFQQELSQRFKEWMQHRIPVSLLLIVVDELGEINEKHGRETADQTLAELAATLAAALPDAALIAKYDEMTFGAILTGHDMEAAKAAGERARSAIAATTIDPDGLNLRTTASIGVSSALTEDLQSSFLGRCDSALHAAKTNGRNRTYFFEHGKCLPVGCAQMVLNQAEAAAVERPRPATPIGDDLKKDRRARRRTPFHQTISIAPYRDGRTPTDREFIKVQCHDISAGGISFFFPDPPAHSQFIVILGFNPEAPHVIANVVRTAKIDSDGVTVHLVGCAFCGRLQ